MQYAKVGVNGQQKEFNLEGRKNGIGWKRKIRVIEQVWELFLGDTATVQLKKINDNIDNMLTNVDEISE